jgi:hypothetical protein
MVLMTIGSTIIPVPLFNRLFLKYIYMTFWYEQNHQNATWNIFYMYILGKYRIFEAIFDAKSNGLATT